MINCPYLIGPLCKDQTEYENSRALMTARIREIPLAILDESQLYVQDHLGTNHRIYMPQTIPIYALRCIVDVSTRAAAWKYIMATHCEYLHIDFVGTLADLDGTLTAHLKQTRAREVLFNFQNVKRVRTCARLR